MYLCARRQQIIIMVIERIRIENFRGIEKIDIPVDKHVNLLIGINGAGKTSVLEAVADVFSWFIARLKNPKGQGVVIPNDNIKMESRGGCSISLSFENGKEWVLFKAKSYSRRNEENGKSEFQWMMDYIDGLKDSVEQGGNVPVVMYYPVNRAIDNVPAHLKRKKGVPEIWDTYEYALKGNADFRSFFEWYRQQEDNENEHIRDDRDYKDRNLEVIRKALGLFFPEFSELRVRRNPQRFVIKKKDKQIEFNLLSQGEKCYLTLVCDLARRFALANPYSDNPLAGNGVVLIDEVDLHLHPQWQREIVENLRTIFPNCQFFLSSHSPHVLSDVHAQQLIPLDNGKVTQIAYNPYGRLVDDILSNYFDIEMPRNKRIAQKIEEAYLKLEQNDKQGFETLIEYLEKILGKTDPDVVNLKIEAYRKNRRKQD